MLISRRNFLHTGLITLAGALREALATPTWLWSDSALLDTARGPIVPTSNKGFHFVDVATEAGITAVNVWGGVDHKRSILEAKGSGVAFFDYDHDGWLDIYLTNGSRLDPDWPAGHAPTSHLYKNNRDGTFSDVTAGSGLGISGWQTGVCVGDYNNDGWDDLFCCFWGHNRLFRNNGNGFFTDVTEQAGLAQPDFRWGSGCTFVDYDRDGHLDLFVCNYVQLGPEEVFAATQRGSFCQWRGVPVLCGPRGFPPGTNQLFHNNGDGTFANVSESSGILKSGPRYSISSVACDFSNDGWPDIYVAVDSQPSCLFRNNHDGTFTDVAIQAGCAYSEAGHEQAGMGVAVADYDCDGWFDIYKTNFADDKSNLYHNNHDGTFTDLIAQADLATNTQYVAWGCGFIDIDNNGWQDVVQVNGHVYPEVDRYHFGQSYKNPRLVYRNLGNGKFQDVSRTSGSGVAEAYSSRGAAFGDFNNDGGMDVLILNMNDPPSLLRNVGHRGNWIKVKLLGTECNRTAIGARVKVTTGKHSQIDEVRSGTSVMSQNDLRLHFGVGSSTHIDRIDVVWPTTQKIETFRNVPANQILLIREGKGIQPPPSR